MISKKGQAAMEFLMTYGWAILAAIVAIGVLAYFGVFNPSRLAGSSAVINAPLNIPAGGFNMLSNSAACGDSAATPTVDCITIQVIQNSGQTINATYANVTLTSGAIGSCGNGTATIGVSPFEEKSMSQTTAWQSGTAKTIILKCSNGFSSGDSIAGNLEIKYTVGSSTITQSSTGNVRGVAQ